MNHCQPLTHNIRKHGKGRMVTDSMCSELSYCTQVFKSSYKLLQYMIYFKFDDLICHVVRLVYHVKWLAARS